MDDKGCAMLVDDGARRSNGGVGACGRTRAARGEATDGAARKKMEPVAAPLTRGPRRSVRRRRRKGEAGLLRAFLGRPRKKVKGPGGLKEGERNVGRQDSARDGILEKEKIYSFLCFSWIQTKVQIRTKFV